MPRIKAGGGRDATFDAFEYEHSLATGDRFVILLVDSESVPTSPSAWDHLKSRDNWAKPGNASDDQAHLMVVCMETWLVADPDACADYFGQGFKKGKLPTTELENRAKKHIHAVLASATTTAVPKGKYGKARDSFELLSRVEPDNLKGSCSWAKRFFDTLDKHL